MILKKCWGWEKAGSLFPPFSGYSTGWSVTIRQKSVSWLPPARHWLWEKMRLQAVKNKPAPIVRLQLVIGLFCGWALSWEGLRGLLQKKAGHESHSGEWISLPAGIIHWRFIRHRGP